MPKVPMSNDNGPAAAPLTLKGVGLSPTALRSNEGEYLFLAIGEGRQ